MTDAFVSRNVTKSNVTIENELNFMNKSQGHFQKHDEKKNMSCNCSKTEPNQLTQVQCANNHTAEASIDCSNKTRSNDVNKNMEAQNEPTNNNDTILKYVFKKNETNSTEKSKGHYKNSLRRKRSINSKKSQTAPLIVNYETSHAPIKYTEQWLPAKRTANVIKNSDLADFNIETLHENVHGDNLQNRDHARSSDNDDRNQEQSGEIINSDQNEDNHFNKGSSEEKEDLNRSKSQERENSKQRVPHSSHENSHENDKNYDRSIEINGREINNDDDDDDVNRYNVNNSKLTRYRSENEAESIEKSQETDENTNKNLRYHKSVRNDSDEDKSQNKVYKAENYDSIHNRTFPEIQDVDLDNFSFERIQLNKHGKVEPVGEAHIDKDVEIISTKQPKPVAKTYAETNYVPNESSDSSSSIEANEPTHINDGEIKPVVEINSEANSVESKEENSSLNKENESLETLTGVKGDSNERYDKLQEENESGGDIKQQFERIPLDYNENKKQAKTKDSQQNEHSENRDDEGTVDALAPKDVRYDEHLNIKFDDIAIKLPEIKLPDDIISYAYENPPVYKNQEDKKKQNFFYYNSEEEKDPHKETPHADNDSKPHDDNDSEYHDDKDSKHHDADDSQHHNDADSNDYYKYYGNTKKQQSYKEQKNAVDEEDDDLYEKFVRERFGKRNTFKQRSEKLRDLGAHNPQLYKTVQNIIDRTKNLNKEATKSGDPNAGYMWTLEYGEKL